MAAKPSYDDLNAALLKQLECPVCFEYCTPPILMCLNGHNICSRCVTKLDNCAVCKGSKPSVRNLFAEETCGLVSVPCKYLKQGCQARFSFDELEIHLEKCMFKFDCRIRSSDGQGRCYWKGYSTKALANHVRNKHAGYFYEGRIANVNYKINYDIQNNVPVMFSTYNEPMLYSTLNELFWVYLHFVTENQYIYPYVRFIGADRRAKNYTSEFSFTTNGIRRNLTYQSQCIGLYDFTKKVSDMSLPLNKDTILQCCASRPNMELRCDVKIKLN